MRASRGCSDGVGGCVSAGMRTGGNCRGIAEEQEGEEGRREEREQHPPFAAAVNERR